MMVILMSPGDRTDATCTNAAGGLALICFVKCLWVVTGISSQSIGDGEYQQCLHNQDAGRTRGPGQGKTAKAMVRRWGRKTESKNVNGGWHGNISVGAFLTVLTGLNFKLVLLLFSLRSVQIFKHQEGCGEHIQSTLLMQSSLIFCIRIIPAKIVQCFTLYHLHLKRIGVLPDRFMLYYSMYLFNVILFQENRAYKNPS